MSHDQSKPPSKDPLDRFTRAGVTQQPPLFVFWCGCRRIIRRDGPKVAKCVKPPRGKCYSPGPLATDDEIAAEGLDPRAH